MSLSPRTTGQNLLQSPRLPLEVPYKIVDEVYAAHHPGSGNAWKGLSQTCHALAAYCRPLTFRSIILHSSLPGTNYPITRSSPTPMLVGNIRPFSKAISCDPELCSLLVNLHLDTFIRGPSPATVMQKLEHFPTKEWLSLFERDACRLRVLKLSFDALHRIPDEISGALLQFLARAQSLESLTLETVLSMTITILDFIPPSVKDLAINLRGAIEPRLGPDRHKSLPLSSARTTSSRLDNLTIISGQWSPQLVADNNNGLLLPFDLTNLKHLQLQQTFDLSDSARAQLFRESTPYYDGIDGIAHTILLNAPALCNLRCLEVCTESDWRRHSHTALAWIAGLLHQQKNMIDVQALKISVLTLNSPPETLPERVALWEAACQQNPSPCLKLAHVAAYAALQVSEFPRVGFKKVVPLGVYGGGEVVEYHSLWEGGPCSGWRSR
ncbi:hypothetical protein BKA70DRAFT_1263177 [Coprinopsis sp. MPI-PUGE-AT-0042]|nr:hypothetical protein BKA70DRAFT_1263177 [Coprinopsis sp. MPI-PUGE-AT-0042]